MNRIQGSYPGGPRRRDATPAEGEGAARRLERVEEVEARLDRATRARERRRRSRRIWSALVLALVAAGGAGLYLGFHAHRTSEELTVERTREQQQEQLDLTRETNRLLLELWKMEDLERQGRTP